MSRECNHQNKAQHKRQNSSRSRGFSLLELVVVVALIAVLAAIAVPAYSSYVNRARIGRTISEMRQLENLINTHRLEHENFLPDSLSELPGGAINDPWGHPYQYLKIEGSGIKGKGPLRKDRFVNPLNSDYDLYSMGADGESSLPLTAKKSMDDIVRANNGGFIGLASAF
jgi:general secretion pathway protein G